MFCFGLCSNGRLPCRNCTSFDGFQSDKPHPTHSLAKQPRFVNDSMLPAGLRPCHSSIIDKRDKLEIYLSYIELNCTQLISNSSCLMENDPTFGKYNKNGTGWAPGCGRLNDPILLEKLRREAARRVIGQLKTDDGTLRKLDHACGLWQQPGAIQVLQQ